MRVKISFNISDRKEILNIDRQENWITNMWNIYEYSFNRYHLYKRNDN